jgi:Striatin family
VLLGERKGLQTTHSDLIRRIKMLEYALRQERIKFHRLKFGCDPPTIDMTQSPDESGLGANEIAAGKLFAGIANSLVQLKLNYAFQMASTRTVQ